MGVFYLVKLIQRLRDLNDYDQTANPGALDPNYDKDNRFVPPDEDMERGGNDSFHDEANNINNENNNEDEDDDDDRSESSSGSSGSSSSGSSSGSGSGSSSSGGSRGSLL